MAKFYVTYGCGSDGTYCFSVVEAPDIQTARKEVFKITKGKFAFMYTETDWIVTDPRGPSRTQQELYGLKEVPLAPQYTWN